VDVQEKSMSNLPTKTQDILKAISRSARDGGYTAYLGGELVKTYFIDQYVPCPSNVIDIIISYDIKFDTYRFYNDLIKTITINAELENTSEKYTIISGSYILHFQPKQQFDPLSNTVGSFTIDQVVVNLHNQKIIDPHDVTQSSDILIRHIADSKHWNLKDILGFATKVGSFEKSVIHDEQMLQLQKISLELIKPAIGESTNDLLSDMLLSHYPGKSLEFICNTFQSGRLWLFNRMLDLVSSLNVPISEEVSANSLFSAKKFELINVYNEFFLFDKKQSESGEEKKHRLLTTLRQLFDSPSLSIDIPYIDRVSVFIAENAEEDIENDSMSVQLFEDPCPYPPCPPCDPTTCGLTGPPCCCCHSVDIISASQIQCHEQIILSCTEEGTGPGPDASGNYTPFPPSCTVCLEGCEFANDGRLCSGTFPSWWPVTVKPCECTLIDDQHGNPLTCVTCEGVNKYCESIVTILGEDCHYEISLTPGSSCCGTTPPFDVMFVVDVTGSMGDATFIAIRDGVVNFVELGESSGILSRLSLTTFRDSVIMYGWKADGSFNTTDSTPPGPVDYTTDKNVFEAQISALIPLGDSDRFQFRAIHETMWSYNVPSSHSQILIVATNGPSVTPPTLDEVIERANYLNITIMYIGPLNGNEQMAVQTGGSFWDITTFPSWTEIFSRVSGTTSILPSSCDCIDSEPIPILNLNSSLNCDCPSDPTGRECLENGTIDDECRFIPIKKCLEGQQNCDCELEWSLNTCGHTVIITPQDVNQVCCGDLTGFGCDCPSEFDPPACCGASCQEICHPTEPRSLFNSLAEAQEAVWFNCLQEAAYQVSEDCWAFSDGSGNFFTRCRGQVDVEVESVYTSCFLPDVDPIEWKCEAKCDINDETIPASPTECVSVRNPSIVVLNNGIGLVAYESFEENLPVIKISQFKTSVDQKFLANRIFNHGRLQHTIRWSEGQAKLYVYDDPLPEALLQGATAGTVTIADPTGWKDAIIFDNGPLQGQCFPLVNLTSGVPFGEDEIGKFILFYVGAPTLSQVFPNSDDVYNVQWRVYDVQSTGDLIGDAITDIGGATPQQYPHDQYLFTSRAGVDTILSGERITSHIHNGISVPIANPCLANAYNYSHEIENSHFVYLVYQALEDQKWNIYLKQIRISEYERDVQVADAVVNNELIAISSILGAEDLTYRVVCSSDKCSDFASSQFLVQRTVVFELLLSDGRGILNPAFNDPTDSWGSLCEGVPPDEFPKRKVISSIG